MSKRPIQVLAYLEHRMYTGSREKVDKKEQDSKSLKCFVGL